LFLGLIALFGLGLIVRTTLVRRQPPARAPIVSGGATIGSDIIAVKGESDAPVTVVEYADFQCPACGYFTTQLQAQFERDYVDSGKVRLIFHDFPLPQHRNAIPAAEAARCAADQNAFWDMHEMLFFNQPEWVESAQPLAQFTGYADEIKIDRARFEHCMTSHTHRDAVLRLRQQGMRADIRQTPTFLIDGEQYTMNELWAAVDTALAAKY
jgi:protein-disulfide isomerase